jgi:hypothetical protein
MKVRKEWIEMDGNDREWMGMKGKEGEQMEMEGNGREWNGTDGNR